MSINALTVWTNNSDGTVSPPEDDCERVRIASAEISLKRIFGGPMLGIILVLRTSFKLRYLVPGYRHSCDC